MRQRLVILTTFLTLVGAVAICHDARVGYGQNSPSTVSSAELTNEDIIGLVKAGLSADIILAKIRTSACDFDTSPAALEKLKASEVPANVILAMVNRSASNGAESSPRSIHTGNVPEAAHGTEPPRPQSPASSEPKNRKPVLLLTGEGAQNRHHEINKHWLDEFAKAKGCFETVTSVEAPHDYELRVNVLKKSAVVAILGNQQPEYQAILLGSGGRYIGQAKINPKVFGQNHNLWSRARSFAQSQICGD